MEEPETTTSKEIAVTTNKLEIKARYIRTYMARLIQSEDSVKDIYNTIKNKMLSYKKVKCRLSKKRETFYIGRKTLIKLDVKGKKLDLYLALNPSEFVDKAQFYNYVDISEKNAETPMLMKVSGPIKLKRALELIEILMQSVGAVALTNYAEQDYRMPYESTESLIERGLIKDLGEKVEQSHAEEDSRIEEELSKEYLDEQEKEVLDAILGKEEIVIRENEAFYNGEKCVFKPYFEGYKNSDAIIIPITKEKFDRLKESKKVKIFNGALKKFNKRTKKK
jgi:hypothetical protein